MFKIGGEVYEPIDRGSYTFAYDAYMQEVVADSGLHDLLHQGGDESTAVEALRRIVRSEKVGLLLAGLVKPAGADWTPAWARETAEKFMKTTDPTDKRVLQGLIVGGLQSFFGAGPRSFVTSP